MPARRPGIMAILNLPTSPVLREGHPIPLVTHDRAAWRERTRME